MLIIVIVACSLAFCSGCRTTPASEITPEPGAGFEQTEQSFKRDAASVENSKSKRSSAVKDKSEQGSELYLEPGVLSEMESRLMDESRAAASIGDTKKDQHKFSAPEPEAPVPNGKIKALVIGDEALAPAVDVLIRPGYIVNVLVMASGRKEVDESQKRVSAEGHITLPLVGRVEAAGLTMLQLSDKLVELYSKYLRDPMVDVDFVLGDAGHEGAPWGFVTVLGRVKQPGRVAVPPTQDLTLSTAIKMAGGFDKSAKMTGIKITRETKGKTEQMEINLQSIGDAGKIKNDVPLLPGDFVFVPERFF